MEKTSETKPADRTNKPAPYETSNEAFAPMLDPAMLHDPKSIAAAQRLIGNQAVQRLIQRQGEPDTTTDDATSTSVSDPMHLWLSSGPMPSAEGMDVVGAGMGGFNARFEPSSRTLVVTVNIGFTLLDGLNVDTATGLVTPNVGAFDPSDSSEAGTIAELTAAATNLNDPTLGLTPAEKVAIVQSQWQWASGESDTWLPQYQQTVQDAWSDRHFFQCEDFPQLLANVRVNVNAHLGAQEHDHCAARIVKTPPQGAIGAYVSPGQANNPNDQGLVMSSASINPRTDNLLQWQIFFQHDSDDVATATGSNGSAGPTFLQQFKTSFDAASATGGPPIRLVGHASSDGDADYNQRLAGRRAANVEAGLRGLGIVGDINRITDSSEGETGATTDAAWRRVDIIIGNGEAQTVGAHEFGHIIGLDDEYATQPGGLISGTGNAPGTPVAHNDVNNNSLGDVQIDGAVAENNDNIMSLGTVVRPQHYSTFHNALQIVTGKHWRYGGEGDAPDIVPGMTTPDGGVIT
jgi:outer membrane protein OmpA-like peptidoglycan-associated protein